MLVVDYSWAHPDPVKIAAAGYVGVMRYLSIRQDTKVLGAPERDAIHAQGLGIGLIWQTTATEVREGAAVGLDRRSRAEDDADELGYPAESPIFHAVDYDARDFSEVRPYMEAVCDRAVRPVGLYGHARIIEQAAASGLPIAYWWQCAAWSRGVISPLAHLYQRVGHTNEARRTLGTTDENRLYQPLPLWLPGGLTMWTNPAPGRITSGYGPRPAPLPSPHLGTDVANAVGTPVKATTAGEVVYAGTAGSGLATGRTGLCVILRHADADTYYGHLSRIDVKVGQRVGAGQRIGLMGATGNVTGPHLHFEVRPVKAKSGTTDPVPYLRARGVTLGTDPYTVAYIRDVQTLLNTVTKAGLVVDGDLGPRTIAAVEAFQRSKGLRVDGDPGPITLRALRDATIPPAPPKEEDPLMAVQDVVIAALAKGEEGKQDAGWVETRLVDVAATLARVEARLDALESGPDVDVDVDQAALDALADAVVARIAASVRVNLTREG